MALMLATYLYYGLPATARFFYEVYHLWTLDWLYHAYSGFKLGAYFLDQTNVKLLICLLFPLCFLALRAIWVALRRGTVRE